MRLVSFFVLLLGSERIKVSAFNQHFLYKNPTQRMTKNNELFGSNGGEDEVDFTDELYDDIRTAVQILGKRAQSEEQVSKDQYMDLKDASESIINDAWEHIGGRPGGQFKI